MSSFSIVVETANLATASHELLAESLDSLESQSVSPALATDVVILDSGEAAPDLLQQLKRRYPWLRVESIPEDTDYGDQKSMAASFVSGDILVFADSDCVYRPGWLHAMVKPFADRPDLQLLAGETAVLIQGPFTLAMALVFFFPRFSFQSEIAPARGFYGNNVAMRRSLLQQHPFPAGLPIYRGQNVVFSRMLWEAGVPLWRQPLAQSVHSPPENFLTAIRRFFWTGRDTPRLRVVGPQPSAVPFQGDYEPYSGQGGGRLTKLALRLRDIARQQPGMLILWLPFALPIALSCVAAFFCGVLTERCAPRVAAPAASPAHSR